MDTKTKFRITFGSLFVLPGIVMIVGSGIAFKNTQDFVKSSSSTTGTVIELKAQVKVERSKRSITYLPIVSYKTQTGETINFESNVSSNPPEFSVGQQVTILYNRDNPNEAKINSFLDIWFISILLLGIGGIFTVTGLILHLNDFN